MSLDESLITLNTLKNTESVLVEVNEKFSEQHENIKKHMLQLGFLLKEKRQSKMVEGGKYEKIYNQIWIKNDHKT